MIIIDQVISLEENMTEKDFESDFSLLDLDLDLGPPDLDSDSDLNYLDLTTSLPPLVLASHIT
jgi:hypothetical protein